MFVTFHNISTYYWRQASRERWKNLDFHCKLIENKLFQAPKLGWKVPRARSDTKNVFRSCMPGFENSIVEKKTFVHLLYEVSHPYAFPKLYLKRFTPCSPTFNISYSVKIFDKSIKLTKSWWACNPKRHREYFPNADEYLKKVIPIQSIWGH